MGLSVAVVHPFPGMRRALVAEFQGRGFQIADQSDDLIAWLSQGRPAVVVLPPDDPRWISIRRDHPHAVLVAIVDHDDHHTYQVDFATGASAVVSAWQEVGDIVSVVVDAAAGQTRLPVHIAQHLAAFPAASGPPSDVALTDRELEALRLLSAGETVVAIANHLAVSEREMHRMLSSLYLRMGTHNRTQAIVRAALWGLIARP